MYFKDFQPGDLFIYCDYSNPKDRVIGVEMIVAVNFIQGTKTSARCLVDITWWSLVNNTDERPFFTASHNEREFTTALGEIIRDGEVVG